MNEIIEKDLKNLIYKIDGVEVMLDSDIANLYEVETKRINEAVQRNPLKFPKRFSRVLTDEEEEDLRSQIATSRLKEYPGGRRYNTRVFTEQGVAMLATILKSEKAIKTSIAIMDAFVNMRNYIKLNNDLLPNRILLLEERVDSNTKKINEIFDMFDYKEILKDFMFYKGQLFEAHVKFLSILESSRDEIIIIDNYAGKELLNSIKEIDKKIIIVSNKVDDVLKKKYEKEYNNVTFIQNDDFHDRFIILDRRHLFSCGSSFKDIGKQCFLIHEIDDDFILKSILSRVFN